MNFRFAVALLTLSVVAADDCGAKPAVEAQRAAAPAASVANAPAATSAASGAGACALIESAEVEAVQGGKVRGAIPNTRADANFSVTQCYYTAASADGSKNLSVHVEVMADGPDAPGRTRLADFWQQHFREAKDKRKSDKPKAVEGLGAEAFWVGNERMGALYVLKAGKIVRLSLGGPDGSAAKIEKSKALAAKALGRLIAG